VKAFVVGEFDTQALKAFCRSQLAAYKYPRIIERVLALPKGNKGQILRRVLKDSK
jgi:long-chain acyl-CoA synthetase